VVLSFSQFFCHSLHNLLTSAKSCWRRTTVDPCPRGRNPQESRDNIDPVPFWGFRLQSAVRTLCQTGHQISRVSKIQCPICTWNIHLYGRICLRHFISILLAGGPLRSRTCKWRNLNLNISLVTICSLICGQYRFPYQVLSIFCSSVLYRRLHVDLLKGWI